MSTTFSRGDITVDRIVELEVPFADALSFLPGLKPDVLDEHRSWLVPTALDREGQLHFRFYLACSQISWKNIGPGWFRVRLLHRGS